MNTKNMLLVLSILLFASGGNLADAQGVRRLLAKFARKAATKTDDFARKIAKEPNTRIFTRRIDDVATHVDDVDLDLVRRFDSQVKSLGLDHSLIRSVRQLPKPHQARFLRFANEMTPILKDPRRGLRVVALLDVDGLRLAKTFGDDVVEATALVGDRRFLDVFRRTGEHGVNFFRKWIRPHWKKWATSSVLTAFLLNPERFIDSTGNLTEHAVASFTKLGIRVAAAPAVGVRNAIVDLVKESPWRFAVGIFSLIAILFFVLKSMGRSLTALPRLVARTIFRSRHRPKESRRQRKGDTSLSAPGVDDE